MRLGVKAATQAFLWLNRKRPAGAARRTRVCVLALMHMFTLAPSMPSGDFQPQPDKHGAEYFALPLSDPRQALEQSSQRSDR
jgi:hypothetical protein